MTAEEQRMSAYGPCAQCGRPLDVRSKLLFTGTEMVETVEMGCPDSDWTHNWETYFGIPDVSGWAADV